MAECGQFNQCGLKQRAGNTRSLSGRSTYDDGYNRTSIRLIVANKTCGLEPVCLLNGPRCLLDPFPIPSTKDRGYLHRILSLSVPRIVDGSMKCSKQKLRQRGYVIRLYVAQATRKYGRTMEAA